MKRTSLRVLAFVLTSLGIVLLAWGMFGCDSGTVILKVNGSGTPATHQEAAQ